MAYINTGNARMKTITVTKRNSNGDIILQESRNITMQFVDPNYPEIVYQQLTDLEFSRLSYQNYSVRLTAFRNYLFGQFSGLQQQVPNTNVGAYITSHENCIIGNPA